MILKARNKSIYLYKQLKKKNTILVNYKPCIFMLIFFSWRDYQWWKKNNKLNYLKTIQKFVEQSIWWSILICHFNQFTVIFAVNSMEWYPNIHIRTCITSIQTNPLCNTHALNSQQQSTSFINISCTRKLFSPKHSFTSVSILALVFTADAEL